ncbi:LPS-assembly lipoprotein LptE [Paraglaciecola psychrophila]|uniref:LPS-assembly lipoprotein LptE n=1 Tax=Paraglaciecola psychrophila 170 TaxID=1129794 RepID=K6ZJB5_9ALTE|nr:LPS assembly lipoprotein LptE [Paraglaciecola psychrophila]AGH45583.1 Rare lipoprotein B [Paraglaciecola psychrophila 170]GAC36086.1 LPS-assembly lipoprotein [Paraglaciecola psychrophila 170]
MLKRICLNVCILTIVLTIVGCGFKLRGDYGLPTGIQQLQLLAAQKNTPLHRILGKQLQGINIDVWDNTASASQLDEQVDVIVYLSSDQLERRLLSLFSSGQVAEYELVYTIKYQIQFPAQDAIEIEIDVTREYQDDPDAVLAKSRELDLIQNEMRQEAANRIIRQIASSYSNWQQTTGG